MSSSNLPMTEDLPATADPASSSAGSASLSAGNQTDDGAAQPADPVVPTEPDEVAAAAVDLARQAAEETAEPNTVGEHLGVTVDDGGLTMHSFVCTARGYRGWRWAVTLARVPGFEVTVCDVVLLPGADSILAPAWVPWSDRLEPGDLGAGDDLPYRADDPLLVPGYTVTDEDDADQQLFWELGLGRERVVGLEGLQAAADRWEHGAHGPTSEIAIQASAACLSCAYFLPVSGFLRQHFGVCTNEWSPADGTVVTTDFGCGAHSETDLELPAPEPLPPHILDEMVMEHVQLDRSGGAGGSAEPPEESEESAEAVGLAESAVLEESEPSVESVGAAESAVSESSEPVILEDEPVVREELVAEGEVELDGSAEPFVEPELELVLEPESITEMAAELEHEPELVAEGDPELDGSAEPVAELELGGSAEPVAELELGGSAEPLPEPKPELEGEPEAAVPDSASSDEVPPAP